MTLLQRVPPQGMESCARLEIWESGQRQDGKWVLRWRHLVLWVHLAGGDGGYFLRDRLPKTDKRALVVAARVARVLGMNVVKWRNIGNRNTRYIEGVRFDTYKHERSAGSKKEAEE